MDPTALAMAGRARLKTRQAWKLDRGVVKRPGPRGLPATLFDELAGATVVDPDRAIAEAPAATLDAGRARGLADQLRAAPATGGALARTIVVAVAAHAAHATCRAPVAPGRREGAGAALVNPQRALAVAPGTT